MNKLKFILAASIAATLTLSCSDGGGDDGGGSSSSGGGDEPGGSSSGGTTYKLTDNNGEYFTYLYSYEGELCNAGRFSTSEEEVERTQTYSISNKTMIWGDENDAYWGDTIKFQGTSNNLTGIWTRTRSSCDLNNDPYGGDDNPYCKTNYDITKAVFTDTTVAITRDECPTDIYVNGQEMGYGWTLRVVNCNKIEISKGSGSNKMTITENRTATSAEMSYGGRSCKWEGTKAKKQTACRRAWEEWGDDDYVWIMNKDYSDCWEDIVPEYFYGYCDYYPEDCDEDYCEDASYWCEQGYEEDCEYYYENCEYDFWAAGKIAAKPVAKAKAKAKSKITPLLKKKN